MRPKIALITPYSELGMLAGEVACELNESLVVKQAALEEAIQVVRKLEEENVDVIISRGGTAAVIRKNTSIPVVLCEANTFDVLLALHQGKKFSNRVALFVFNQVPGLDTIAEILDLDVCQFCSYEDLHAIEQEIERAMKAGFEVIVGSLVAVRMARERGLKAIPIYTSKETVREAILKAREIAMVRHKEAERAKRMQAILDFAYDGIIVTNEDDVIEVFNPAAEKITGIRAAQVIGQKAEQWIPNTRLVAVKENRRPEVGELQEIGKTTIVTNRVPIIVKDKVVGVVATFHEISRIQNWERKIRKALYSKGLIAKHTFDDIIGNSQAITTAKLQARNYGFYDSTVLLVGETGTGKELFAHAIHSVSPRNNGPFVAVNCSALPDGLLESELFGYEEGAFTGARRGGKPGLFELAHGGTIFLDEISSISLNMQARLLRVIQEKEVMRLGSDKLIPVDVRIIVATNKDLAALVARGKFREDLYFRLNVLRVRIPPLRERREDIPLLAQYFLDQQNAGCNLDPVIARKMQEYRWPGNVRELKSFISRYAILVNEMPAETIFEDFLHETFRLMGSPEEMGLPVEKDPNQNTVTIKIGSLDKMERELIQKMLARYDHNRSALAKALGISRSTLWKKLKSVR
ncbi:PAS domain S-box protein [Desulfofundulus thermobenzoicus]|uniref:PAS domain S-box protein n=1 Tax=Desulfofundulus thermobenzoicus TaxID=29376 RepID=A0A6N7IUD2_9FIRM|nr:sigma-54-dependent Fis family transcriptional regulator [Desulfofundulus thermobenzoicus]MQL53119.1 PAS domain S-box protein [Desulfofundulus thermobenzoicus]